MRWIRQRFGTLREVSWRKSFKLAFEKRGTEVVEKTLKAPRKVGVINKVVHRAKAYDL
jgi:hypothetical protein